MSKRRKPREKVSGLYAAIPIKVLDSVAFVGLPHAAKSLLFELFRQINGRNNGHLHLSTAWLRQRGWTSRDVTQRAKRALLERGLIVKTRVGGLNMGPDLYALTWLPISDYTSLDIAKHSYPQGAWRRMGCLKEKKRDRRPA